jgi:hypothetical protein
MQRDYKNYDREKHDLFKAITVKNPFAHWIAIGVKTIEVRSRPTNFRGRVVITSSHLPEIPDMLSGAALCTTHLYDCIQVKELTEDEWLMTCLPKDQKHQYRNHYAWMLKDTRSVIELPVKGNLGIWNLVFDKEEFMEYPVELNYYQKQYQSSKPKPNHIKRGVAILIIGIITITALIILLYKALL